MEEQTRLTLPGNKAFYHPGPNRQTDPRLQVPERAPESVFPGKNFRPW